MGWRWIVDTRGGKTNIDKKWLAIAVVLGVGLSMGLRAILLFWVAIAVVLVIVPVLLYVDVRSRRTSSERTTSRERGS